VPEMAQLLETVRSRLAYAGRFAGEPVELPLAKEFLAGDAQARIKLVRHLYTSVKEENKLPYRNKARALLDALEYILHADTRSGQHESLTEVVFVRQYITDPSSSLKMLLEHLAYALRQK